MPNIFEWLLYKLLLKWEPLPVCPKEMVLEMLFKPCPYEEILLYLAYRFDRELVFPLPNLQARAAILHIHTKKWSQPPTSELQQELANRCVGYCGADLKAWHAAVAM